MPTRTRDRIPDADSLGKLAQAAAETARSHLDAADVLLAHGFWPQARALAVLAFEEAGEAYMWLIALLAPYPLREKFPFRDLDWNHQWKLKAAQTIRSTLLILRGDQGAPDNAAAAWAELEDLARGKDDAKQRSMYTDYRNGTIQRPAEVTEEQARNIATVAKDVIDHAVPIIEPLVTGEVPASVDALLARAAAFQAGGNAPGEFVDSEIATMRRLAGSVEGYPVDTLATVLAAASHVLLSISPVAEPAPRTAGPSRRPGLASPGEQTPVAARTPGLAAPPSHSPQHD
jgi:AbiV family abortive infection protein